MRELRRSPPPPCSLVGQIEAQLAANDPGTVRTVLMLRVLERARALAAQAERDRAVGWHAVADAAEIRAREAMAIAQLIRDARP